MNAEYVQSIFGLVTRYKDPTNSALQSLGSDGNSFPPGDQDAVVYDTLAVAAFPGE